MSLRRFNNYLIALVWLINGLYCKVLGFVPRHEMIVAKIFGQDHSHLLIILIGVSELLMAAWIISGYRSRLNAVVQILVIASMNIIEAILAADLLLFGYLNLLFASFLTAFIYWNEFLNRKDLALAKDAGTR